MLAAWERSQVRAGFWFEGFYVGDLGIDGSVALNWILKKKNGMVWTGLT
jgi:hypothetical protein